MKTKSILLLRHGETNWNIEQRFQGSRDLPLNEKGEEQARQVSLRIKSWHPEFVVSSPLMRAFKTSVLASGWHEESIKRDPDLCEINFGVWEGCSTHELKEQGELFHAGRRSLFQFLSRKRSLRPRFWLVFKGS